MKRTSGFTLIELMIVVAIIGILSAIAIPKFADLIRKSNEGATKGNLGAIRSALSIYYGEIEGWYPISDPNPILTMENGKYLKEIPPCNTPPYHVKVSSFNTIGVAGDDGSWGYQNNRTPAGTTEKNWGDVWVNCTHTDSKSAVWSTY